MQIKMQIKTNGEGSGKQKANWQTNTTYTHMTHHTEMKMNME